MADVAEWKQFKDLDKQARAQGFKLDTRETMMEQDSFTLAPTKGLAKILLDSDEMAGVRFSDTYAVRNWLISWEIFTRNLTRSTGLDQEQIAQLADQQRVLRALQDGPKPRKSRRVRVKF